MNYLECAKKALDVSSDKLSKPDVHGAVTILQAALAQVVAHLQGENLDAVSDPDLIIHFDEDCGDGEKET
jgi:hypothetical protein